MEKSAHHITNSAFSEGASDVFLIEDEIPRIRKDDIVKSYGETPIPREQIAAIWRECGFDPGQQNDGDASLVTSAGRLRVNAYKTLGRLGLVMRPIKEIIPTFKELGLPTELLQSWLEKRSGLILVCGPTGSGKSTTVAACLEWINQNQRRHIVTMEDPIEYSFHNKLSFFSQREIHHDVDNYKLALRQSLRQNPDVIFLGEIRDTASALAALRAAETGHLVISTLHASGVAGVSLAMKRIGRMVSEESSETTELLANQLIGVMSQQLLPRINGGMMVALEYFENAAITRKLIAENSYHEIRDFIDQADGTKACSFLRYLSAATQQGFLDAEVARSACDRPQDFDRAMRGFR